MEELTGTTIFWLIALGMVAGALVKVLIWNRGVELIPNLVGGIAGALIVGGLATVIDLYGSMAFAFLGSLAILFILNVFHMQSDEAHA